MRSICLDEKNVIRSDAVGTARFDMNWKADKSEDIRSMYERRSQQIKHTRRFDLDTYLTHLFAETIFDAHTTLPSAFVVKFPFIIKVYVLY